MLFSIDPLFSEAVKKGFDFITPPNNHGYDASVVMVPKKNGDSWRLYYRIDMLSCGLIVCTVRDRAYNNLVAVLTFTDCQHGQIEIERAELYRNGSNYPYRVETNSRYMGKYEEIACFVYGAIMGGMLSSEAARELAERPETATCDNSPTAPESRPQSATETAKTPASDTDSTEATKATQGATTPARETANGETTPASSLAGETTPKSPAEPARSHQAATDGTTQASAQIPRHACENAPQRTKGVQGMKYTTAQNKAPPRGESRIRPKNRHFSGEKYGSPFLAIVFFEN